MSLNRRQFIRRSVATLTVGGVGTLLYTWRVEPHWIQFVERAMPVAGLPRDLHGRTLVLITDLHVGRVDQAYVIRTLERARALRPDFVVYGGDFISYDASRNLDALRDALSHAPTGRLATVAVLGNHDYGPDWAHPEIAARVSDIASASGIHVLRNSSVTHAGLQVIGLDDLWANQFRPRDAFASFDRGVATIAVSHNPDSLDEQGWEPYSGWILSGHTHGGQCKPPFLPPPILPVTNRRYTSGAFDLSGGRRLYISRGVGHLLRVRFNVRPEVTVATLVAADSEDQTGGPK